MHVQNVMKFAQASYIKQHMLIHTGEKNNMHVQNLRTRLTWNI